MAKTRDRRETVALVACACCLLVSAALTNVVVVVAAHLAADLVSRGDDLRVVPLAALALGGLAISATIAMLGLEAVRGSPRASRRARRAARVCGAGSVVAAAVTLPVLVLWWSVLPAALALLTLWWIVAVPATFGSLALALRWAAPRLS